MHVLVTGGTGYIGSHTVLSLIEHGHVPVVVDNLSNSSAESLKRVEKLTGTTIEFHQFDVRNTVQLTDLLSNSPFDASIHFAGLKAVGESVEKPLMYYRNNLDSTMSLIEAVQTTATPARPGRIIFSSSATVYGNPEQLPYTEDMATGIDLASPYAQTKYMGEQLLKDECLSDSTFQSISLRYFNPIGAHVSGEIGEDPTQVPNNLMPYVSQVAVGRLSRLGVFGNDYETRDGTGVRDYVHVMDLAEGHVAALEFMRSGFTAINLGTGNGTSVFELIKTFESSTGQAVPFDVLPRRSGDIAEYYASATLAAELLGWSASLSLEDACRDTWSWQSKYPDGFNS